MSVHFLALRFDSDGTVSSAFGTNCIHAPKKGEDAVFFCMEGPFMREGEKFHAYVDYVLVSFPEPDDVTSNWYCFTPQGMQCPFPCEYYKDEVYTEMFLSPFRLARSKKKIVNNTVIWQH